MATRKNQRAIAQNTQSQIHHDTGHRVAPGLARRQDEGNVAGQSVPQQKRSAFGDITNANQKKQSQKKKGAIKKLAKKTVQKVAGGRPSNKDRADGASRPKPTKRQRVETTDLIESSQEFMSSQSSQSSQESISSSQSSRSSDIIDEEISMTIPDLDVETQNQKNEFLSQESKEQEKVIPDDVDDVDEENMADPTQVALYAKHIFDYYKDREKQFVVDDYLTWQKDLSCNMRAILVDWLVEVQENFELNHETLYLAIKMVDLYLMRRGTGVPRQKLQLVGATALFIACKFDERFPPVLDDFLYICDDAYKRHELIQMEMTLLKTLDFDIGIPLSYRFLRRYARCARASMETLTLARYILEMSQMEYRFCQKSDSLMAASCLLLALKMKKLPEWSSTLVFFSGYDAETLLPVVRQLNSMICTAAQSNLSTIRTKYSHVVFHEVAKIPALDILELAAMSPS